MRLLAALTAIVVSVLALTGCGFQRAGPLKDTLRINLGSEPPSLDWHVGTDNTSLAALTNMMMGLLQFRDDLSCAPGCAESWDVKDDGKKYIDND